jgi:hypothetical protein
MKLLIPILLVFLQCVFALESDVDRIVIALSNKGQKAATKALQDRALVVSPGFKSHRAITNELVFNLPNELADRFRPQLAKALATVPLKSDANSKQVLPSEMAIRSIEKRLKNQWHEHAEKVLTEWSGRHTSMLEQISAPNTHTLVKRIRGFPGLAMHPAYIMMVGIFGLAVISAGVALLRRYFEKWRRLEAVGLPIIGTAEGIPVTSRPAGAIEMTSSGNPVSQDIPLSQAVIDVAQRVAQRIR